MALPRFLTVIQWNARGLRQKRNWFHFYPFITADVFIFQETFLNSTDSFSLPRMCIYRKDRTFRGGGLLTAVSCSFPSSLLLLSGLDSPDVDELSVRIYIGTHWLTIVNVYAPYGKVGPSWLTSLLSQLEAPYLILGDFNQCHPT